MVAGERLNTRVEITGVGLKTVCEREDWRKDSGRCPELSRTSSTSCWGFQKMERQPQVRGEATQFQAEQIATDLDITSV